MNGSVSKALAVLREGPITVSGLARRLGSDEEEASAVLDILVFLGHVKELTGGCPGCPGGPCCDCPAMSGKPVNIRIFVLTGKG